MQIFIIFHKTIYEECYKNIPDELIRKYFTFYAVNESVPKQYLTNEKYKYLNEWELPIYDASFQKKGYNENSALYHIHRNHIHEKYKYIGFFQYDMVFKPEFVKILQQIENDVQAESSAPLKDLNRNKYYPLQMYSFNFISKGWIPKNRDVLNDIIQSYETHFKVKFGHRGNLERYYPLYNSYIVPSSVYETVMNWVIQLYDIIYPKVIPVPLPSNVGHIGGIFERVMGLGLGEQPIEAIELHSYISHEDKLKRLSY